MESWELLAPGELRSRFYSMSWRCTTGKYCLRPTWVKLTKLQRSCKSS
jgi:hypothetical protein